MNKLININKKIEFIKMSPLFTGFPALIYSGLWTLQKIGILKREFSDSKIKILILVIDSPPAFMVTIDKGDYKIEYTDINNKEDLENAESDMYIATPSDKLLGSADGILDGISNNLVQIKNERILIILGKIASVF